MADQFLGGYATRGEADRAAKAVPGAYVKTVMARISRTGVPYQGGYQVWGPASGASILQAAGMNTSAAATGPMNQQGGIGTGGASGGQAAAAVQAGLPNFTGGGPRVAAQPVNNSMVMAQRADSFLGIDTFTPPDKLQAGYSPDSNNWDGFAKIGSYCVRRGTAKLTDDKHTLSLHADLRGISLAVIPNDAPQQLRLMYCFADNPIGSTRDTQQTRLDLVKTSPSWGETNTLSGYDGPALTATDQGSQVARVAYVYTASVGAMGKTGIRENSVVSIIVRYSLTGFPVDVDGNDQTESVSLRDRVNWDGSALSVDTPALTSGDRVYFSVWAVTIEGYSKRSTASITVA